MLLACPVGTITHLLACVMLVGGLLVPCQQLTSSHGTACPISRIVLGVITRMVQCRMCPANVCTTAAVHTCGCCSPACLSAHLASASMLRQL
ncbi:hypothetical protein COO60DRAFT_1507627, partial [Scenedesmus sp. NREL 46B-D3]